MSRLTQPSVVEMITAAPDNSSPLVYLCAHRCIRLLRSVRRLREVYRIVTGHRESRGGSNRVQFRREEVNRRYYCGNSVNLSDIRDHSIAAIASVPV